MHLYGKVIVIKRNGTDGAHFPLTARSCVFGRGLDSDIRIQLPTVDTSQCQILIDDKEHVFIQSISTASPTLINDKNLSEALTALSHGDIITIVDRKFRFEFPPDSRFYPHKSPKSKSPRTPKRTSMTRLSSGGEKDSSFSRRSAAVTPLSPRTDNVPESIKSPRSAGKVSGQPVAAVNGEQFSPPKTGRQSYSPAKRAGSPELMFTVSPAAFYPASATPGSSKLNVSNIPFKEQGTQAFHKSPATARQKSLGSPYSKTPASLRKSISDLKRRSVPVFETEEGFVPVQTKVRTHGFATPSVQVGIKRKSTAFDFLSAKRKRVSFGPNLSPEHFDKTLPPKTPIKKGASPSRIIKQERKSLLKGKSPGRKGLSPRVKSPIRVAATPPSSQVFEVSTNTEVFSPVMTSPDRSKISSPKSRLSESESRRSENETPAVSSPGRKLSPANRRSSQSYVKLNENDASVLEYLTQEKLLGHTLTSSASVLTVLSPSTKVLEKSNGSRNSSFASSPKSPKSLPSSSAEKKRSVGRPRSRSSPSLQNSASPRSDSSFRKSVSPRGFRLSSAEKLPVDEPPSEPSPSFNSSVTPRSLLVSSAEKRPVGRPPSVSRTSFHNSDTPRRSLSAPSAEKRSVGRPPSRSESDSSFRKSVTPKNSGSALETSLSVRASLSPKNTSLNTSDSEVWSNANNSARARKVSTSPMLSQDLFSQVSPKPVAGRATPSQGHTSSTSKRTDVHSIAEIASPVGIRRIFKTPKHRQVVNISPSAIKRILKTPKGRHIPVSPISPIGLRNLVKTPQNRNSTPSGLKQLAKSPVNQIAEVSLIGVKEVVKSSRNESSDVSFSGISVLFNNPVISANSAAYFSLNSGSESGPEESVGITPDSSPRKRYSQTPKRFLETPVPATEKKRPVGRPLSGKRYSAENPSPEERPVGLPLSEKRPVGRPPSEKRPVGRPTSEKRPVGRPTSEKRPVGRPSTEKRPVGRPTTEKSPVGRPTSENSPVGHPTSEKSPVRWYPSEKSPVGQPSSEKRPVGRPTSEKRPVGRPTTEKSPVGRPTSEKSPARWYPSEKSPVGQPSSERRPVGRPTSEKRPVGRPTTEKSPVGRPTSEKSPVRQPSSEKRPVGRPTTEKSPVGRSTSEKSPVRQPSSERRPVGRPTSEKSPVRWYPSEKSPVGQPSSAKRPVGRPPSEKSPAGRPLSEKHSLGQIPSERRPPSAKKTPLMENSPAEKIVSPPQDFKKVVALRAIHGHGLTPKRATFRVQTPSSIKNKASAIFRKTPVKKTWSDIVKSGAQKPAATQNVGLTIIKPVTKRISPKLNKKIHKTPKTPRALARAFAPTTGHADSPATIIVGRKFKGTQTPKLLPRKGRKVSLSKASRKSVGNTSFTGLSEMFTEPVVNESTLYADIPDTPDGPNEMFVSPLSNRKSSQGGRKSTNLTGVRELFLKKQSQETYYIGVKELFTSSSAASPVSPSGVGRLMKTPKTRTSGVSPTGVKRLLATPKTKSVPVSPVGLDSLFKTPTLSGDAVANDGKSALSQASKSAKAKSSVAPAKSGQRGRKRKSEEPLATPLSKKSTPTLLTADLSPRRSQGLQEESLKNKVASVRKTSLGKSPSPGGKRQSGAQKAVVASTGSPDAVSLVDAHDRKSQAQLSQSSSVNVERVQMVVGDKYILSPPKVSARGRRGKAAVRETTMPAGEVHVHTPPKVGGRGTPGEAQIKKSPVNIEIASVDKQTISPPKSGPRVRTGKAQIKEAESLAVAQSPPRAGPRGRSGKAQIKKVVILAVAQSSPKVGARGRTGKAQIKEAVTLAVAQSPLQVRARGRRGQAENNETAVNINTGKVSAADKHILSPPKVNPRGRRGKAQVKELTETGSAGGRQSRKDTTEIVLAQDIVPLVNVEPAKPAPKGRRGRGRPVQSEIPLHVETAAGEARQSVAGKVLSPKMAARGGRGKSKTTESASVEDASTLTSDVSAASGKSTTRGRPGKVSLEVSPLQSKGKKSKLSAVANARLDEEQIVEASLENKSTVAERGGKRVVAEVGQQETTSVPDSPKRRGGRRNQPSSVAEPALPGKPSRKGSKSSVSPMSSSDVSQGERQIGGVKRKAVKPTSVPVKKVKLDSSVPVTPVKPRATRRGQKAGAKSPNFNVVSPPNRRGKPKKGNGNVSAPVMVTAVIPPSSPKGRRGQLKKAADSVVSAPPSTSERGRPKKDSAATEIVSILSTPSSGKRGRPKKNAAGTVDAVAPPSTGKRGRPKKTATKVADIVATPPGKRGRAKKNASVVTSPPKGRKGQVMSAAAETVEIIAPPSTGKRGRPKKNAAVKAAVSVPAVTKLTPKPSPSKGRQGRLKKASAVKIIASPPVKKRGGVKAAGAIPIAAESTIATRRRRL